MDLMRVGLMGSSILAALAFAASVSVAQPVPVITPRAPANRSSLPRLSTMAVISVAGVTRPAGLP